jgi:hypothetical protein
MSATGRIVVLADDLSGAAELAGIASGYGLTAEVQRRFESTSAADVLAVDCDSRSLPEELATQRVRDIAAKVFANRPAWIFKKIDSVLRGHPRAEIEAILSVTSQPRALLIPANPSRGRIITGGRYLVDGVPLDQTVFDHDPEFPRRSADVAALLGNDANQRIQLLGAADALPPEGIAVPDVATVGDLGRWAAAVDNSTLGAGAADFFAALIQHRNRPRRLLQKAVGEWLGRGFDADTEMLELIHSGRLSDSPVGQYLHTMKQKFRGPVVADLLCYLRVRTELALRAKGILMMRESGFEAPVDEATRDKFTEMRYLEQSIGRTAILAIQPMLHLSHKDLWQLHMLGK